MKIQLSHSFEDIISLDNLLNAWNEFILGKRSKKDVLEFSVNLMDNIILLHDGLANGSYEHSGYENFFITDPKPRHIHKASVRDRLLHHAIYRILYPFFEKTFIADSFSNRVDKGTHKAVKRFKSFADKVSKNNTRTCWVLKGDIKKFFASVNHEILKQILSDYISDQKITSLLRNVIDSFGGGAGIPLGNLTSQLFANVYLNIFDQFIKHKLKAEYYVRYADDFIVLSNDHPWLESLVPLMQKFLAEKLRLRLHPDKIFIKTLSSGVDFLGTIIFPCHKIIRIKTKRRALRLVNKKNISSYLGICRHANAYEVEQKIIEKVKNLK
jgi:retron-type reverse transcriptase